MVGLLLGCPHWLRTRGPCTLNQLGSKPSPGLAWKFGTRLSVGLFKRGTIQHVDLYSKIESLMPLVFIFSTSRHFQNTGAKYDHSMHGTGMLQIHLEVILPDLAIHRFFLDDLEKILRNWPQTAGFLPTLRPFQWGAYLKMFSKNGTLKVEKSRNHHKEWT